MSIDTLIANRKAIPETIRQAGYPWLANQTESDLAELCRAQTAELRECQQQRDNALAALRAIVGAIEDEFAPGFGDPGYYTKCELAMLARARDVLSR